MKLHLAAAVLALLALSPAQKMSATGTAAKDFLATLSEEQRKKAVYPLDSPERTKRMYVPGERKGVSWAEMSAVQKESGMKLLKAAVSEDGMKKLMRIRDLELVLREMENNNMSRDPEKYWFVFFGAPSEDGPWVWRYEGHHLSLTFGNNKGVVVSSTPQFIGSNPAEVRSGNLKGTRMLADLQDRGYALLDSLTAEQKKKAVVSETAPADIVTAASRNAAIADNNGITYRDLSLDQRKLLLELISAHASVQAEKEQKRRLDSVKKSGYDKLVFAWLGSTVKGGPHYYRIQGDGFVIEYDNTQNDANHIHTVWRDLKGDFGDDLLAEHYAAEHSRR